MAFTKINNSEFTPRSLYTGMASAKVLAVNPTKAELEQWFGPQQSDPVYLGETTIGDKTVKSIRTEFVLEVVHNNTPLHFRMSMFLNRAYARSSKGTVQIIDDYGQTAWATEEEIKGKKIPVYSNGNPARIDKSYVPAFVGEERLTKFIRALFCLNDTQKYDAATNSYINRTGDDLEACKGRLDDVKNYFDGNIKELKDAIELALNNNNRVRVLFGVRTNNDGRQFQTVYTDCFVKNTRREDGALRDFQKALDAYAPANTEFEICDFKEYVVPTTNFATVAAEASPVPPVVDSDDDFPFVDTPQSDNFGDF